MMKGHCCIELTDVNTGEVKKYEEDNLVTNAVKDLIESYIKNGGGATDGGQYSRTNKQYPSIKAPIAPVFYGGLMLWSAALTEDVDHVIPFTDPNAKLVGWAGDQVSTESKHRGSLNAEESGPFSGGYKFVWDFTTSQANGTIAAATLTHHEAGNNPLLSPANYLGIFHERQRRAGVDELITVGNGRWIGFDGTYDYFLNYVGFRDTIHDNYVYSNKIGREKRITSLIGLNDDYHVDILLEDKSSWNDLAEIPQALLNKLGSNWNIGSYDNVNYVKVTYEGKVYLAHSWYTSRTEQVSGQNVYHYTNHFMLCELDYVNNSFGQVVTIDLPEDICGIGKSLVTGPKAFQISGNYIYSYSEGTHKIYRININTPADIIEIDATEPYEDEYWRRYLYNTFGNAIPLPNGAIYLWGAGAVIYADGTYTFADSTSGYLSVFDNSYQPSNAYLYYGTDNGCLSFPRLNEKLEVRARYIYARYDSIATGHNKAMWLMYLGTIANFSPVTKTVAQTMKVTYTISDVNPT